MARRKKNTEEAKPDTRPSTHKYTYVGPPYKNGLIIAGKTIVPRDMTDAHIEAFKNKYPDRFKLYWEEANE